jgi:ribosomal protein S18 acetylase RimI-like enzyme
MPEIEIRPAVATDIATLLTIEHTSQTDYVWQLDLRREPGQVEASLREIRLPRTVPLIYPRSVEKLPEEWSQTNMLVALAGGSLAAYLRMNDRLVPGTVWITDLVVGRANRRKGIGTALMMSAHSWAQQLSSRRAMIELQSKNHAAIRLVQKLGYEFCGYNDQYYATRDVALFFGRLL